jgi:DNA-binding SARP family transcriptional activator/predicted negative regulator of RcsB-dependent stress response
MPDRPEVEVQLLGPPRLTVAGAPVGVRGHKPWGVLAYLAGAGPTPRDRLAALLFTDATDPLAALRWNLSQLRRATGRPDSLVGDPLELRLGPDARVDVEVLLSGRWFAAVELPDVSAPLLEGLQFPSAPGFQLWLEGERHRLAGTVADVLHEAAQAAATAGDHAAAARHARARVRLRPYDEQAHELLVRSLADGGYQAQAREHVAAVTTQFLDELGLPPSKTLQAAAETRRIAGGAASRARTVAQLEAGTSATAAGAPETGLESLRRAVAGARAVGDTELLVRALTVLGGAEVHAVRGRDESGANALREAVSVAERAGRPELATTACRELGYVNFLRCRTQSAEAWLDRAAGTAGDDSGQTAWIHLIRGSVRTDTGRYEDAEALLGSALALAEDVGDLQAIAFSLTHLGRLHVVRGELAEARAALEQAVAATDRAGWLTFSAYPLSWLAEVALQEGRHEEATDLLDRAHALALEVGDPCWETMANRGRGLLAAARGDDDEAALLLHEAPRACRRLSDTYLWVEAYAMAAQARFAVQTGDEQAAGLVDDLDRVAAGHGLRQLQAEAALLRAELGLPGALEAATALVADLGSAWLAARLPAQP